MKKYGFLIFTLIAMPIVLLTTDYSSAAGRITAVIAAIAVVLGIVVTWLERKREKDA